IVTQARLMVAKVSHDQPVRWPSMNSHRTNERDQNWNRLTRLGTQATFGAPTSRSKQLLRSVRDVASDQIFEFSADNVGYWCGEHACQRLIAVANRPAVAHNEHAFTHMLEEKTKNLVGGRLFVTSS